MYVPAPARAVSAPRLLAITRCLEVVVGRNPASPSIRARASRAAP